MTEQDQYYVVHEVAMKIIVTYLLTDVKLKVLTSEKQLRIVNFHTLTFS